MIPPPRWTAEELDAARARAVEVFRRERIREPLEAYLAVFDASRKFVEDLLRSSSDLIQLEPRAIEILTDPRLLEAFRALAGPPVSADDLKTLAEAVLSPARLRSEPGMARRVVEVVMSGLDRRRFPWVVERREPARGAPIS